MDLLTRRSFIRSLALALGGWLAAGWRSSEAAPSSTPAVPKDFQPLEKSRKEWRALLTPPAYDVLFEEVAPRRARSRLRSDPWLATKMLAYFPLKAVPKRSSSRLLERTMTG